MKDYDLYGFSADDIDAARSNLEAALEINFEARDSLYLGDYFSWNGLNEEELILKRNIDPFENTPDEEEFSDFRILLYINRTIRSKELRSILESKSNGISFLSHKEIS